MSIQNTALPALYKAAKRTTNSFQPTIGIDLDGSWLILPIEIDKLLFQNLYNPRPMAYDVYWLISLVIPCTLRNSVWHQIVIFSKADYCFVWIIFTSGMSTLFTAFI